MRHYFRAREPDHRERTMELNGPKTKTCVWCVHSMVEAGSNGTELECRRYAPRPGEQSKVRRNLWPVVRHDEWCGEFEAAPDDPEEETVDGA